GRRAVAARDRQQGRGLDPARGPASDRSRARGAGPPRRALPLRRAARPALAAARLELALPLPAGRTARAHRLLHAPAARPAGGAGPAVARTGGARPGVHGSTRAAADQADGAREGLADRRPAGAPADGPTRTAAAFAQRARSDPARAAAPAARRRTGRRAAGP